MAKSKLNIFLAKEGLSINDVIRDLDPKPHRIELEGGVFLFKDNADKTPKWVSTFFQDSLDDIKLANKTIQAVYLLDVEVSDNGISRVFAFSFGLGRNLLRLEQFEQRFGLTVALNLLDENLIRRVDSNTISTNPKNSKVMLGKLSKITEFEVDMETNLLKSINGKIEKNRLGDSSSATGLQSLSVSVTTDYLTIRKYLPFLYETFKSTDYKKKFPGINHTLEIKDKILIDRLNESLVDHLFQIFNGETVDSIALTMQEFLDENIESLSFKIGNTQPSENLNISDLIKYLCPANEWIAENVTNKLHRDFIRVFGPDDQQIRYWKLYNCLIDEVNYDGHQYVLNEGKWYKYEDDYVKEVSSFYERLPLSKINLPEWSKVNDDEDSYNKTASKQIKGIHWDKELIHPDNQSKFELCDVFDPTSCAFIHVKMNYGSAVLSHLINQGFVSGELMLRPAIRKKVIEKKQEMEKFLTDSYNASNFKIVIAIADDKKYEDERPRIPFFSKVTFRNCINRLQNYGYSVELKRIRRSK